MKLLKMKIIRTEDTTYLWIPPPHNGLLDIYTTQTCHVHNTNHSMTQKLPPLAYHTVIRNTYFKTINSCTCNPRKSKCIPVPLPLLHRRSKDSEELQTANCNEQNVTKLTTAPPPPQIKKNYYTIVWKPKIHQT